MNVIDQLLGYIAPHRCVGCGSEGAVLCAECMHTIDAMPSICYACGKATYASAPCEAHSGRYHPQHVWIATSYVKTAKKAIWAYKLEQKRAAVRILARRLVDTLPYFSEPPLVTFVPTASSHRRQRGFDHSELLAKELATMMGWPYCRTMYRRTSTHQRGANRETRKTQLLGAFRATNIYTFDNKHVLLIDDVITTGATIEECTRTLKKAGATNIDALVFARTPQK